jgi:hypothetical protein
MGMSGAGRPLGGYGAATIGRYYSNGMGTYMPYNGNASGFVPYRGGYGGGVGVQPIPRRLNPTAVGGASMPMTPIGGASLDQGMRTATRRGSFLPFGYEGGLGFGADRVGMPMTDRGRPGRRPSGPGFGYPFQWPTLDTGSGSSIMAMP